MENLKRIKKSSAIQSHKHTVSTGTFWLPITASLLAVTMFFSPIAVHRAETGEYYAGWCPFSNEPRSPIATIEDGDAGTIRCYFYDTDQHKVMGFQGWIPEKHNKDFAIARCAQYFREDPYVPANMKKGCSQPANWQKHKGICWRNVPLFTYTCQDNVYMTE